MCSSEPSGSPPRAAIMAGARRPFRLRAWRQRCQHQLHCLPCASVDLLNNRGTRAKDSTKGKLKRSMKERPKRSIKGKAKLSLLPRALQARTVLQKSLIHHLTSWAAARETQAVVHRHACESLTTAKDSTRCWSPHAVFSIGFHPSSIQCACEL